MQALLRRFSDRAGELTGEYSQKAYDISDTAAARLGDYRERARKQANRLYDTAMEYPTTTYTVLGVIAVGIVAAGVWGFMRYREQRRLSASRGRSGGQRSRRRVKAGEAASAG
jgi:hypothetical protein